MILSDTVLRRDPQADADDEPTRAKRQGYARLALVAVLLGFGLWTIRNFLPALAWAAIISIAIWPLFEKANRRWPPGKHNVLLPALFTAGIAILFGLPFIILAVQGAREAHDVLELYQKATTSGSRCRIGCLISRSGPALSRRGGRTTSREAFRQPAI